MTPTERLYYAESYLRVFEAIVVAHGEVEGRPAVALDRSAFYPEGGGQPGDTGLLGGQPVADVQADDGVVWHILADQAGLVVPYGSPGSVATTDDRRRTTALHVPGRRRSSVVGRPELVKHFSPAQLAAMPVGATVRGELDWARRFDHMQQHCGQHLLTAAFVTTAGLPTIAFHLGAAGVTIDLDTPELSAAQARAAEDLANAVVWEDRPVTARFVSAEELASIPLRKAPTVSGPVRVVSVPDFDYSACGGTHPRSTGGVGLIAVLGWSRQRGGTRVAFACGGRALAELRRLGTAASGAAAALSVGIDELPAAAERAVATQRATGKELVLVRAALDEADALRHYAGAVQMGGARIVCAELPPAAAGRLRALAQTIAAQPGGVAILGAGGERAQVVVACAPDSGLSAADLLRAGLPLLDGRGGGNTGLAQGGGPRSEGLETALAAIRKAVEDRQHTPHMTKI